MVHPDIEKSLITQYSFQHAFHPRCRSSNRVGPNCSRGHKKRLRCVGRFWVGARSNHTGHSCVRAQPNAGSEELHSLRGPCLTLVGETVDIAVASAPCKVMILFVGGQLVVRAPAVVDSLSVPKVWVVVEATTGSGRSCCCCCFCCSSGEGESI